MVELGAPRPLRRLARYLRSPQPAVSGIIAWPPKLSQQLIELGATTMPCMSAGPVRLESSSPPNSGGLSRSDELAPTLLGAHALRISY